MNAVEFLFRGMVYFIEFFIFGGLVYLGYPSFVAALKKNKTEDAQVQVSQPQSPIETHTPMQSAEAITENTGKEAICA